MNLHAIVTFTGGKDETCPLSNCVLEVIGPLGYEEAKAVHKAHAAKFPHWVSIREPEEWELRT